MRKSSIAVVTLAILLVAGAGVALYTGTGPAPGGADTREQLTDYPTGTPIGTADRSTADAADGTAVPFSFAISSIDECGQTCREVTATLHNNQNTAATDVTVFTRVYAGEDTTDPDDLVWEGRESVETLDAGASSTSTRRVELSVREGLRIERNGGWVTVVTTVRSAERTVTFRDSERVS